MGEPERVEDDIEYGETPVPPLRWFEEAEIALTDEARLRVNRKKGRYNVGDADTGNIIWIEETEIPPRYVREKKYRRKLKSYVERFIDRLKERPGAWAVYAENRKTALAWENIPWNCRGGVQVRNIFCPNETFSVYMCWVGDWKYDDNETPDLSLEAPTEPPRWDDEAPPE